MGETLGDAFAWSCGIECIVFLKRSSAVCIKMGTVLLHSSTGSLFWVFWLLVVAAGVAVAMGVGARLVLGASQYGWGVADVLLRVLTFSAGAVYVSLIPCNCVRLFQTCGPFSRARSPSAGVQAAWELRLSDLSVESFDDMNVINFRQIFADREFEPGMLQLEVRKGL